ncbi:MAG TPA: metal ABC transporter substrate-binding protein [Chloroflexia bacterium]|nr:metal ABC transporter substrate-binding protein [Chloroflexia bacterium]
MSDRSFLGRRPGWLAAGLLILLLTACSADAPPAPGAATPTSFAATPPGAAGGGKLVVVATTTQIRSLTEAVAGDLATVRAILKPGADPHEYEPVPSDVQMIGESALVLKNGVGLDNWLDKIIAGAGGQHPVVTVSDGVPLRQGAAGTTASDPHIWFSVSNAMTMTRNIRDALVRVDAPHATQYQANTTAYLQRLAALDTYIHDQIATLPDARRKMVTNHDAFGYYIHRYGLSFVGSIIPALSTEAAPSAADVAALIEKIRAEHVPAIFLESSINPQLAQQIGGEAGVKVVDTLYGDSLGDAGTPGATYESMMRYDTDTIVSALK